MNNRTAYIGSAVLARDYPPPELLEVALAGRSNVGKSALINTLAQHKNLARISGKPGKTRTLNFYRLRGEVILVDLPGYGYAKVSKEERKRWGNMIDEYLNTRDVLRGLIQVVDIRHPPSELDCQMFHWIQSRGVPFLIVATKADKISRGAQGKHLKDIRNNLGEGIQEKDIIPFSAPLGLNKDRVWAFLKSLRRGEE